MKKRDGFTLIELIVAMAIMAIIFGGIIYLFGASSTAAQTGMNQQQAYEDARQTMDLLKTTLRYTTDAPATTNQSTSLTYSGSQLFDEHWNLINGSNGSYTVKITYETGKNPDGTAWSDKNKKQLVINYSYKRDDSSTTVNAPERRFPKYEINSALVTAGSVTDGSDKYESGFPIVSETSTYNGKSVTMYKVLLPVAYKSGSTIKVDTMTTRVTPEDFGELYKKEIGGGNSTFGSLQEAVIAAVTSVNTNDVAALLKDGNSSQQYIPRISSGGMYQDLPNNTAEKTAADAIKKFLTDAGVFGAGKLVDNQVWLLEPILSSNQKTLLGWYLYVGKNVINDVGGVANANGANIANAQGLLGTYYIRRNYGFLTYRFKTDAAGNFDSSEYGTDGVLGYATGTSYEDETNRVIYSPSWIAKAGRNYLEEYTKINTHIEDYHYQNGKQKSYPSNKVTHYRIDYDGTGEEYTLTKHTGDYAYPPNGPTDTTGNGK